jgi:WD40 repeat protein
VQRWNVTGRPQLVRRLRGLSSSNGQPETVTTVAFSHDGRLVDAGDVNHTPGLTPYRYGSIAVWDAMSGRLLWKVRSRRGWVDAAPFSPDGKTIAAAYEDGSVVLYESRTGRTHRTLELAGGGNLSFETAAFAPNGMLATGTWAGIVQLWNPATGKELGRPTLVAAAPVASLAFDPVENVFATTGGSDGLAKLWRTDTLQQFGATFPGDPGQWGSAAFTPDGAELVVAYQDGTGVVWPASAGGSEKHACAVAGRNFSQAEWALYVGGRRYAATCP